MENEKNKTGLQRILQRTVLINVYCAHGSLVLIAVDVEALIYFCLLGGLRADKIQPLKYMHQEEKACLWF